VCFEQWWLDWKRWWVLGRQLVRRGSYMFAVKVEARG